MKKNAVRIIGFLVILSLIIAYWNSVFKFKYSDGIYDLTKFYQLEDNSVDVLILGSSHAFEDFNTGVLWDDHGIASYILAGSIQPMWNTYYYLKEALKTQKPQLIVLEGYCTVFSDTYSDDSRIIKNNYGLKWSSDKIKSLKISASRDRWKEFFPEFIQYHNRYKDLTYGDYARDQGNPLYYDWKGFGCNMSTSSLTIKDVSDISERAPLPPKSEAFYRKTIELAKEHEIPIIVVVSPFPGITEDTQKVINSAKDIATEMDVPFLDCNLLVDEIGLDYSTDVSDYAHLNHRGNQIFTHFIGDYFTEHYVISDHTGEPGYETWQRNADFIRQMISDQELKESQDLDQIFKMVNNPVYQTFISTEGSCRTSDEQLKDVFNTLGITDENASGIWYINSGKVDWSSGGESNECYLRSETHDFALKRYDDNLNSIVVDNNEYVSLDNGVTVVIFDPVTDKVADSFGIDADKGYVITRDDKTE